jgi:hypothetical protein
VGILTFQERRPAAFLLHSALHCTRPGILPKSGPYLGAYLVGAQTLLRRRHQTQVRFLTPMNNAGLGILISVFGVQSWETSLGAWGM